MTAASSNEFQTITQQQWIDRITAHVDPDFETLLNRKQARYPLKFGTAKLTFQDGDKPVCLSCRLLDVSATGVMVKAHRQIAVHTPIWADLTVNDEQISVAGRVVHATATVGGYKLGMKLTFTDEG